jgi:exopolysaccharide production protein ExoQ
MSSVAFSNESMPVRLERAKFAVMPFISRVVLFLAVFGNGIDITRGVDRGQGVSLSFQVVFRIGIGMCALLVAVWAWWRLPAVRIQLMSYRGWLMLGFILCGLIAIPGSVEMPVSIFVASMLFGYTLLAVTCLALHGYKTIVLDIMWAVLLYVVLGWVFYIGFPEIGVYREYLSMTQSVDRMGGMGHPNTLGRSVCLVLIMMLVACRQRWVSWKILILIVPLFVATMIESKSRSPVIATLCAILVFCLPLLRQRVTYLLVACGLMAVAAVVFTIDATIGIDLFIQRALPSVTKSGDLSELTSLTGRTEIWSESWRFILERPWTGYGGGTSARIMHEHSGHAHNMLLETALLYGIPAALIVATLLCINIKDSIDGRIPMVAEITAFLVLLAFVESPMVGMPADPLLGLWLACLFARPLDTMERQVRHFNSSLKVN